MNDQKAMTFIDDPSLYSSSEEYSRKKLEYSQQLMAACEKEEEIYVKKLDANEKKLFKRMFELRLWPASFRIKEESEEATKLYKMDKEYKLWRKQNENVSSDIAEKVFKAVKEKKDELVEKNIIDRMKRFRVWYKEYVDEEWSPLEPLSDKEFDLLKI